MKRNFINHTCDILRSVAVFCLCVVHVPKTNKIFKWHGAAMTHYSLLRIHMYQDISLNWLFPSGKNNSSSKQMNKKEKKMNIIIPQYFCLSFSSGKSESSRVVLKIKWNECYSQCDVAMVIAIENRCSRILWTTRSSVVWQIRGQTNWSMERWTGVE